MSTQLWKRTERRIARELGAFRVSQLGRRSPDVANAWLCVEVKERRLLPAWITGGLDRAVAQASHAQLPLLILHSKGRRDDLVVMRLAHFKDFFGGETHDEA